MSARVTRRRCRNCAWRCSVAGQTDFRGFRQIQRLGMRRIWWRHSAAPEQFSRSFRNCVASNRSSLTAPRGKKWRDRFMKLMQRYGARAKAVGSGFEMNPSPGNIRDGLVDRRDEVGRRGEKRRHVAGDGGAWIIRSTRRAPGLKLQCTPGNDVECVTAQVGAGANVVLFTTGLGTPTGNPIAPVVKLSTNTELAQRMPDIIDIDTGGLSPGKLRLKQWARKFWTWWFAWPAAKCEPRRSRRVRKISFRGNEVFRFERTARK